MKIAVSIMQKWYNKSSRYVSREQKTCSVGEKKSDGKTEFELDTQGL